MNLPSNMLEADNLEEEYKHSSNQNKDNPNLLVQVFNNLNINTYEKEMILSALDNWKLSLPSQDWNPMQTI